MKRVRKVKLKFQKAFWIIHRLRVWLNKPELFQNRPIIFSLIGSITLIIAISLFILWRMPFLPPQIPFFFTLPGIDRLIDKEMLWFIPLILILLFVINILLADFNFKKEKFIAQILTVSFLLVNLLSLLGVLNIIILVS